MTNDERYKHIASENCPYYENNNLNNAFENSYMSSSCDKCINYKNGECGKHIYDSLVTNIIRNN